MTSRNRTRQERYSDTLTSGGGRAWGGGGGGRSSRARVCVCVGGGGGGVCARALVYEKDRLFLVITTNNLILKAFRHRVVDLTLHHHWCPCCTEYFGRAAELTAAKKVTG